MSSLLFAAAAAALLPSKPTPRVNAQPTSLPLDSIVLEELDEAVWADEALEFSGLRSDPRTPRSLRAHISSFRLESDGAYCHAFDGAGETLSKFAWSSTTSAEQLFPDRARALLILQLLVHESDLTPRPS